MTNGNDPAKPVPYKNQDETIQYDVHPGLTKREHIAVEMMNGLLSNHHFKSYEASIISVMAVANADALIKALNK